MTSLDLKVYYRAKEILKSMSSAGLLSKISSGVPVVILDDRRELEGDLFCPAQVITPEVIQLMVRQGSGVLCISLPRPYLEAKGIPRISEGFDLLCKLPGTPPKSWQLFLSSFLHRGSPDTPFHFPVDLRGQGSGVSVLDRFGTIQALMNAETLVDDFEIPGHLATLGACPGGLSERWGHTEATIDLCRAAGLFPAGVLCELVGDYGEMRRGDEIEEFASRNSLPLVTMTEVSHLVQPSAVTG